MYVFPVFERKPDKQEPNGDVILTVGVYPSGPHGYLCVFNKGATENTVREFFKANGLQSATKEEAATLRNSKAGCAVELLRIWQKKRLAILEKTDIPPENAEEDVSQYIFIAVHV